MKTRQGWVLLSPLELLAVEAVGGATSASAVGGVASVVVGGVASASAVGGAPEVAAVTVGASSVSMALASEMEVVASAAVSMAFTVLEVVYPAAEDVTSSMGAPTVATWPVVAGTLWGRSWIGLGIWGVEEAR
eukprot:g13506.t1